MNNNIFQALMHRMAQCAQKLQGNHPSASFTRSKAHLGFAAADDGITEGL
jgi:hypothetical protein